MTASEAASGSMHELGFSRLLFTYQKNFALEVLITNDDITTYLSQPGTLPHGTTVIYKIRQRGLKPWSSDHGADVLTICLKVQTAGLVAKVHPMNQGISH